MEFQIFLEDVRYWCQIWAKRSNFFKAHAPHWYKLYTQCVMIYNKGCIQHKMWRIYLYNTSESQHPLARAHGPWFVFPVWGPSRHSRSNTGNFNYYNTSSCSEFFLFSNSLQVKTPTREPFSAVFVLNHQITGLKTCWLEMGLDIWNLGTHDFRYDFALFFIYMNSYMNS